MKNLDWIKVGKQISQLDNTIKKLSTQNKELIIRNRKYSGKVLSLNKEINGLKTIIQMMENEKQ